MSKTMIIGAAFSAIVIATPALAQDQGGPAHGQSAGSGGGSSSGGGRTGGGDATAETSQRESRSSRVVEPRRTPKRSQRAQCVNNLKQIGLGNH
ncbi:hypothetical protein [Allosphingosinicella deserti]|uniref:Uncharacterized protein n=1 Tax=Allosphingosinicella deserti TaxID=2116704 RepID=A0A2P7QIV6_9SPHN|nr:hypothetical protein [Sphingomonas deserti]PSJ37904.1 hypothetical protein C7I55_19525 [Sphingomonas deserti]